METNDEGATIRTSWHYCPKCEQHGLFVETLVKVEHDPEGDWWTWGAECAGAYCTYYFEHGDDAKCEQAVDIITENEPSLHAWVDDCTCEGDCKTVDLLAQKTEGTVCEMYGCLETYTDHLGVNRSAKFCPECGKKAKEQA